MIQCRTTMRLLIATLFVASLWFLFWWQEKDEGQRDSSLWREVTRLPEQGVELTLQRGDWKAVLRREAGRWRIVSPIHGYVPTGVVERLLNEWSMVEGRDPMTFRQMEMRGLTRRELGLDPPRVRLEAATETGRPIAMKLGLETPLGEGVFAELEGDLAVVVVSTNLLSVVPTSVYAFVNRQIWDFDWTEVIRVEVERRPAGFFQLARENGVWRIRQPFDDLAEPEAVHTWLQALWSEEAEEVLWAEKKPDAAALGVDPTTCEATLTIWREGKADGIKVYAGRAGTAAGERAYLQFAPTEAIYAVSRECFNRLTIRASDFLSRRVFRFDFNRVREFALEQGDRRLLLRRGENGLWQMVEPVQAPADRVRINQFFEGLARVRSVGFLEEGGALGVEEPVLVLLVRLGVGPEGGSDEREKVMRLYAPAGGTNFYRLVIGEIPPALLDPRVIESVFGPPPFWRPLWFRDREILGVLPSQIRTLTVQKGGVEQTIRRDENGRWVGLDGRAVILETAEEIAGTIGQMRAADLAPYLESNAADYGFDSPVLRLEIGLEGAEGIRKTLLIGREVGSEPLRYARVLGQDVLYLISPELFACLNRDLLQ